MIPPEEYLRARGWTFWPPGTNGKAANWEDPVTEQVWVAEIVAEAVDIQVLRDEDCKKFQCSRMATMVLEECARRNAERAEGGDE